MGFFGSWLDKNALQSFKDALQKNEDLPIACRIIVAEMIEKRYDVSLNIMKNKTLDETKYHLHIEGKEAGTRLEEFSKIDLNRWINVCRLYEASLSQALYHCLQCDKKEYVLFASEKIMEYILTMKSQRTMHSSSIEKILGI
jgi:hypothetical protein